MPTGGHINTMLGEHSHLCQQSPRYGVRLKPVAHGKGDYKSLHGGERPAKGCPSRKFLLSPDGLSLTEEFWVIAQDTPQSCPCQGVKKLSQASTSHCLGSTAGGWMLAPWYLSCVHRVLRATESHQGKRQGWYSEAVRELCREMARPEGHSRGSQPLAQIQTASCHLKDEMLEVSLRGEGQRTVQRLLGICPNSCLRIDHVTLDGATFGTSPGKQGVCLAIGSSLYAGFPT